MLPELHPQVYSTWSTAAISAMRVGNSLCSLVAKSKLDPFHSHTVETMDPCPRFLSVQQETSFHLDSKRAKLLVTKLNHVNITGKPWTQGLGAPTPNQQEFPKSVHLTKPWIMWYCRMCILKKNSLDLHKTNPCCSRVNYIMNFENNEL